MEQVSAGFAGPELSAECNLMEYVLYRLGLTLEM